MTESVVGELAPVGPLPTIVIEPAPKWPGLNVREMWANRELLVFLVWRDIKVQYAQTVLGAAWAVVQPLMTMLIFTLVFGRLAKIPSDGVPYSVFTLAALIPWMYFSNAFSAASSSLVNSSNLITKVYFPRLIIPIVSVLSALVNFAVSCVLLAVMMIWYHVTPSLDGDPNDPGVAAVDDSDGDGRGMLARRDLHPVPRRAADRPVHRADLDVHLTGGLSLVARAGALSHAVLRSTQWRGSFRRSGWCCCAPVRFRGARWECLL